MKIFEKLSNKKVFNEYCDLYSEWFDIEKPIFNNINTKRLIELIENQYINMNKEQTNKEIVALKERINITKGEQKYNVKYCFYNLCFDILNQCKKYNENNNRPNDIENKLSVEKNGFLVELSNWIFGTLEQISIFNLVRRLKKDVSYKFVDLWVVGNLIAAILSSILVYNLSTKDKFVIYIILIYSFLRVFEIIVYQINVLLFHPYRERKASKEYKINSVTRMVISLLHNYVEIMFWYSTMVISIVVLSGDNTYNLAWLSYIRANILCIATLDGNVVKETISNSYRYLTDIIFVEIISGIIMTLISLARFIGLLPGVESKSN